MGDRLRFTILGCGSSPGVPRIIGDWGNCDPANPKNRRRRPSLLVERRTDSGARTTAVVDTGPDFREQMLDAGVSALDAAVYTHAHADHIHGIDDLRGYFLQQRRRIPVHADARTMDRLRTAFGYCFEAAPASGYPPLLDPHLLEPRRPFTVTGEGGDIAITPLLQIHGDEHSLALRIGKVAYCTDISDFSAETAAALQGLDMLVIDALQYKPHPSHLSLSQALEWIGRLNPARAILTHMHTPLDYDTVMAETPANVEPAYDGLVFEAEIAVEMEAPQ